MSDTKVVTVRLPVNEARRVEFIARTESLSVNEVFRMAVDHYVEALRKDEAFVTRARELIAQDAAIAKELV
ncbi:MAG TPA: ribbon-helix-helix protein, CopG family [Mycobacteriales bacterium]|jgi:hypothetical protein|nr:ribbon-helix-helix protein, CopG family [Mycobacteriales bacterium]